MADAPVKRQTAVKIRINDLKNSSYVKAHGDWQPNYLLTPYDSKIARVNLLGTTIESEGNSFTIDDGSDQIVVRSFEELQTQPNPGDVVVVIGKPREFDGIYIVPEIVKIIQKQQKEWIDLRKLELEKLYEGMEKETQEKTPAPQTEENVVHEEEEVKQTPEEEPSSQETENKTFDLIMQAIKELDDGDGADMENIISKSGLSEEEVENVVNNLLMDGEAFEIKPGRLKLLD